MKARVYCHRRYECPTYEVQVPLSSPPSPLSPSSMGEVADQLTEAYNSLDWEACEERYKVARQREMGAAVQAGGEGEQQLHDLLRDPAAASPRQGRGRRKEEEEGCCTIS